MGVLKNLTILCCILFLFPRTVYAEGDGNIDGGGGNVNQGVAGYVWPGPGYDGIRVTVVDSISGVSVSKPVDYTNIDVTAMSANVFHFGKMSKLDYRSGAALTLQGGYHCSNPITPIPLIISGSSQKADMAAIRQYFCSEAAARMVADQAGIPYKDMEEGKFKLVLEPVIYIVYQHLYFAMTTTEAGLYNQITDGDFGSRFPTVIMKNHALAMFLEREDLGFPAYTGPKGSARSTQEMINVLGIGIVSYKSQPPVIPVANHQYRTDTEVITAVTLTTSTQKTPDQPAYARFSINGKTYSHENIYIPEDGSQLAWVKWRTPKEPGIVTITISSNCSVSNREITAQIVNMDDNPPPDPQADDRNDGYKIPAVSKKQSVTALTWGQWNCWWHEDWVWHESGDDDDGYWCDHGWWQYEWIPYSASIDASMKAVPDEKSPTASKKTMKSGYGLNLEATAQVWSNAPGSSFTGAQNTVSYFPEFNYETYWRLLERVSTGLNSRFEFKKNEYSTYHQRSHFTPVWFPDGTYTVCGEVIDAWTPAGMLQVYLTDSLIIHDNLFSDWHVRPTN